MKVVLVPGFVCLFLSCCVAQPNGTWSDYPPNLRGWRAYEKFSSSEVAQKLVPSASTKLKDKAFIKLTWEEANRLAGRMLKRKPASKPYLVRSVWSGYANGRYYAAKKNKSVWVIHSSLGEGTRPKNRPLLVFLDFEPQEMFASIEIAA